LPKARIRALSANAKKLGATVVEDFSDATHMIVSEFITSWEKIANRLGMKEEEELKSYLISVSATLNAPNDLVPFTHKSIFRTISKS
jgi:precorrin-3B methylase